MKELFRIINGALRLDTDKVRNYTAFLADKLEEAGDLSSASHLRKILKENDHQLYPTGVSFSKTVPVDSESRFPLLEKINYKSLNDAPLIMEREQWDIVNEFISVTKSYAQVEAEGLADSLTFLMYGPPGTGKSRLARYIANELGLDLYIARLDGLISSYLGSTSKNIRALFDFASKNPCVLFLDEFDAIAKLRGDNQELGELKRVVNSFIQNLDSLGGHSIVLAATNHQELLDMAIWRRFNYKLQMFPPNLEMRKSMWTSFLSQTSLDTKAIDMLIDLSEGMSGSDIQDVCTRIKRRQVIEKKILQLSDVFSILKNIAIGVEGAEKFVSEIQNLDNQKVAQLLRKRDSRLYSFGAIAELLNISKATVHRWFK